MPSRDAAFAFKTAFVVLEKVTPDVTPPKNAYLICGILCPRTVFDNHIGITGIFHRQMGDMLHSFILRDSKARMCVEPSDSWVDRDGNGRLRRI